jgi:hypothetical protein
MTGGREETGTRPQGFATQESTRMAEKQNEDDRLEEIQDDIDEIRDRIPKNPGLGVPDPDVQPVMPPEADTNPPL